MTSKYLQCLCLSGELDQRRIPEVYAAVGVLSTRAPDVVKLSEIQSELSIYDPDDVAAYLDSFVNKGLFSRGPQQDGEPTYTMNKYAIYNAPQNREILVYFSPYTQFPTLMQSMYTQSCLFPRGVNSQKGSQTTF